MLFNNSNELTVENIPFDQLVDEFRQYIALAWPHGVTVEDYAKPQHKWFLRFAGNPWASSGVDSTM